jgi:AsmA protein
MQSSVAAGYFKESNMGALFKWLVGLLLVLVLLIGAAMVVLPMVVDPNDYKPQIVQTAKDRLGRELVIEKDLSLSVFPWLGVETGGVRIGNAPGFSAPWFAEIAELGVKVKLMPLLSRRVEVDTLVVNGLRLNLERDANGTANWDDLLARQKAEADSEPSQGQPSGSGAADPLSFSVQGIRIDDARVSWDDRQAGQKYLLDQVRLVTGSLSPGATVPVEIGAVVTSDKPAMTLDAGLEASVSSDADLTVFQVAGLIMQLDAKGEGLPAGGASLTLKTDLVADTRADTLKLDNLEISGPAMAARGEISVTAMHTTPAAQGRLSIAETNPKTLASMFASPIETADPAALTRASGEVSFAYADGVLKVDPLSVRLDESKLTGQLQLLDSAGPVVRTRMELDQIDLDRYLPPPVDDPAPKSAEAAAPASSPDSAAAPAPDPFAALSTLDFEGEFAIGKLTLAKARMSNVTSKIVSRNGVLKVNPMNAQLYQGKFTGSAVLDASGRQPQLHAKEALTGIEVGPLLEDLVGEARLTGRGEVHADIRMTGMSEQEIRRSLSGTSRFAFRDGALQGVNIAQIIRDASSALGLGSSKFDTGTPGQTDFSELGASLTMNNGVIRNDDLHAKSPLLRIEGRGQVDLPKDAIDYRLMTELVGSLAGQGGKGRDELAGIPIPVRIRGSLADPSYEPDLEDLLRARAQAEIDKRKDEVQEKAEKEIRKSLDGVFKGLFK